MKARAFTTAAMLFLVSMTMGAICLPVLVAQAGATLPATNDEAQREAWKLLITPLVFVGVGALRRALPRMKGPLAVALAPALGALLDVVGTQAGIWPSSAPVLGAVLGSSATWGHQLLKQTGALPRSKGEADAPDESGR